MAALMRPSGPEAQLSRAPAKFRQTRTLEVAVSEAKGLGRAADFAVHVLVDGALLTLTLSLALTLTPLNPNPDPNLHPNPNSNPHQACSSHARTHSAAGPRSTRCGRASSRWRRCRSEVTRVVS